MMCQYRNCREFSETAFCSNAHKQAHHRLEKLRQKANDTTYNIQASPDEHFGAIEMTIDGNKTRLSIPEANYLIALLKAAKSETLVCDISSRVESLL